MVNFITKLKTLLVSIIFINILVMGIHLFATSNTLSTYKENMEELGVFILKSFEIGNRVYMIAKGHTNHNLNTFVSEFKEQKSIENIVIYDVNKTIIASAYDNNIPEVVTGIDDIKITYNKKNLVIYKPFSGRFTPGTSSRMRGMGRQDVVADNKDIYLAISLNNRGYHELKIHFYTYLVLFILLSFPLMMIYIYIVKLINLYALSENKRKIAEKHAELGKLSNILAHEIRNPLSSIKGLIKYVQNKIEEKEYKGYLDKSIEELDRLNKIVSDFLSFGKEITLNKSSIKLNEITEKAIAFFSYEKNEKNILFKTEGESFPINADKEKFLQVIMNLLINAIQSSPPGKEILIRFDAANYTLSISNEVADIHKTEDIPKLFEPFHSTKVTGTGLGLSISKKILELHGFGITIVSMNPFTIKIDFNTVENE